MVNQLKNKLHEIIFGTHTPAGRRFDLVLLIIILLAVLLVMLESIPAYGKAYHDYFVVAEWVFTAIFSLEYLLRIWISPQPVKYMFSFWGLVDLLSVIPTFLALYLSGYQSLRVVRAFRLLRIFRIMQLHRFTSEAQTLYHALKASYYKISVFLIFVVMIMLLTGTIMYVVEGGENGFSSIPESIYWAIVTVTTVGFGDITPQTGLGKFLASVMMIIGYAIIAVPTGIISYSMSKYENDGNDDNLCPQCKHDNPFGSLYCNQCGKNLTD